MSVLSMCTSLIMIESAATDESQHSFLLETGVMDAVEYVCVHDFVFIGLSLASYGAGAAVALVGRNEGGKTLGREAVGAIAGGLSRYFHTDSLFSQAPPKQILAGLSRVATMAISDANKRRMMQCDGLTESLVQCLVLGDGNARRQQDGADVLQEAAASTLHELSLFAPWAQTLQA